MKTIFQRVIALLIALSAACSSARADVYDDLRAKWVNSVTGGAAYTVDTAIQSKIDIINSAASSAQSTLEPANSTQPYLYADAPNPTWSATVNTADMTTTYTRLAAMGQALRTKGSAYEFVGTGSAAAIQMRDNVKRGVLWMYNNSYKPDADKVDPNWWDLEIGCSGALGNILAFLSTGPFAGGLNGAFSQTEIDSYSIPMYLKQRTNVLNGSGANGVWKCRTWALLGMLRKNKDTSNAARDFLDEARARLDGALASDVTLVTTWDSEGFRVDSSFYGHIAHAYTGGYGQGFLSLYLQMQEFFTGTAWPLNGSANASMVDWITNGSDLSMFRLQFFQSTRGRYLTRYPVVSSPSRGTDAFNGKGMAQTTIRLANVASSTDAALLRQMVKEWMVSNPSVDLLSDPDVDLAGYLKIKEFYDNYYTATTARPVLDTYKQFTETSYAVVQRPAFAASVAMFTKDTVGDTRPQMKSNEISTVDTPLGAFLSNGALQVLTNDFGQYTGGYYENIDFQRLPGTTIDSNIQPAGQRYENASNFAGGVSLGRYGVTGFELQPKTGASETALGKFHARKAWFFFDKEIVALGSDIRRTDATVTHSIHTIVENWKIRADNANVFETDVSTAPGTMTPLSTTLSSTAVLRNGATRAWLQGNASGTDMGYYFPAAANLVIRREQRTNTDPQVINNAAKFLTMWISHGVPSQGSYQYVLLPNFTEAQTTAYANAPEISVLENSVDAQAVRKISLGFTGALFLKDQSKTISAGGVSFLTSDKRAAALVQETAGSYSIAVSDPTWENSAVMEASGLINLELNRATSGWETKSTGVTVVQTNPTIKLQINVDAARGKTFVSTFLARYEAESFATPAASSGAPYIVYPTGEVGASGGGVISYNATAVNDYVTFKLWHQMPGTYKVFVQFKRANNRGKIGVSFGTDPAVTAPIGNQSIDLYAAANEIVEYEIATVTFSTAADRFFKFTVTGKNASSSGYRIAIDSIRLVPQ